MPRDIVKVPVGCQHGQVVAEAELGQQRIDRSDLDAGAPAFVSQFGSVHMITPVGNQQRQRCEPVEDLRSVPRSRKPLQKLLQHQSSGHEFLAGFDCADQLASLDRRNRRVAPESQRPDAGVDKEAQRRERSAL